MKTVLSFPVCFVLIFTLHVGYGYAGGNQDHAKTAANIEGAGDGSTCAASKAAACHALCMIYIPYYAYGPFRAGCLDGMDVCWCCDPSFDSGGDVQMCPDQNEINCNNGCHQFSMTDVSNCPTYVQTYPSAYPAVGYQAAGYQAPGYQATGYQAAGYQGTGYQGTGYSG